MSTSVIWNGASCAWTGWDAGPSGSTRGRMTAWRKPPDSCGTMEKRQNQRIAVPEEIAFLNGWISREELAARGHDLRKNGYGQYLLSLAGQRGRIELDGALGAP